MPKKAINVNNFSGGLNNKTNPRDLEDSEFTTLNCLDNETPGQLSLFGTSASGPAYSEAHNSKFNQGNGLSYITLDRDPEDTNEALTSTELYLVNDVHNKNIDLLKIDNQTEEHLGVITYGTAESPVNNYVIDGEVRLSGTNFSTSNNPQWYGYVDKTYNLGVVTGITVGDGLSDSVQEIAKTYTSFKNENSYIAPLKTILSEPYGYDPEDFNDTTKIDLTASEITLNKNLVLSNTTHQQITGSLNTHATINTLLVNKPNSNDFNIGHGPLSLYVWFDNENSTAANLDYQSKTSYIPVYSVKSGIKYSLFASNVYDGQESFPVYIGDVLQPTGGAFLAANYKRTMFAMITGRLPKNSRQSGVKVYWALSEGSAWSRSSFGQKYLFMDIDFTKGIRYGGEDNYNAFGLINSTNKYYVHPAVSSSNASAVYGDPISNLSQNEPYLNFKPSVVGRQGSGFKTSAIANRRAYIGNVAYYTDKEQIIKSDTVLKSNPNEFDTFPENSFIDVEINDGDEIVRLETLNNQLLEFKKNTLYIINISRNIEFLEGSYKFRGCEKEYHVIKGDGFIAWFNKVSAFLYDGQAVVDIILSKTGQPKLDNWRNNYYHDDATISYSADKKTIFIFNSNNNTILQFDLKSQSWSFSDKSFSATKMSNVITDNSGDMVYVDYGGSNNTLKKWNDTSAAITPTDNMVLLETKDMTFNNPDIKKNINTVYINYMQPNTSRIQLRAKADGGTVTDLGVLPVHSYTQTHKITMPAGFKGIKSFQLQIAADGTSAIDAGFAVNDIQIVFRDMIRR